MMASLPTHSPGIDLMPNPVQSAVRVVIEGGGVEARLQDHRHFRRDNRAAFKPVFREFVLLCRQLDLFGRELIAVDGTRLKAVNNKDRNFTPSPRVGRRTIRGRGGPRTT